MYRNYPLTATCVLLVWIVCLVPVFPDTPLSDVTLIDKWTHLVMYAAVAVLAMGEYAFRRRRVSLAAFFRWAGVGAVAMGGIIEVVQATCTFGYRSGEWLDFAADTLGVLLGWVIGIPLARCLASRGRGD